MRHVHVFDERNERGERKKCWTRAHWDWIRKIEFPQEADEDVLALYISEVRHIEAQKRQLEKRIGEYAREDRRVPASGGGITKAALLSARKPPSPSRTNPRILNRRYERRTDTPLLGMRRVEIYEWPGQIIILAWPDIAT